MTKTETIVVAFAREAHRKGWTTGSDVSTQTRLAQAVCGVWQDAVRTELGNRFTAELGLGHDSVNEKIDLVDTKERVAYELKASEKNPHMEFYRDIFKVLVFNRRNPRKKLWKLIFITPKTGAGKLDKAFGDDVKAVAMKAGLVVLVAPI